MLLRGIRAQLSSSCASLLLALVVTAGSTAVVGASRVGHTPEAVATMLGLYGVVALAEQTARSSAARGQDVALARLRGLSGPRLVGFAAGPQLAVVLLGTALGAALGVLLAGRIADHWHTAYSVGGREVLVAVAILLGAWTTIGLVAAATLRRPLAQALSVRARHLATPLAVRFLEILLVVAAVAAVYEAHRADHGWVPAVAPALVALAAGQVVSWLLLLTPRLGRRLGTVLTSRRLRRDPEPASVVRTLTAAGVLLSVTLTGAAAAASWRADAAHLRSGGPIAVPFRTGALLAYTASRDADPRGRWLMSAAVIDDERATHRRVFVDSSRWAAVVGDFYAGTSAAGVSGGLASLAAQPRVAPFVATQVRLQVDDLTAADVDGLPRHYTFDDPGRHLTGAPEIELHYVSDQGYPADVSGYLHRGGSIELATPGCRLGCSLVDVDLSGRLPFTVSRIEAGNAQLVAKPLVHTGHEPQATAGGTPTPTLSLADDTPQLALTTRGLPLGRHVDGIDGQTPAVEVVGEVAALPLLGREGSLLDLGRVLLAANGFVPATQAMVVARADTPATVLARLRQDGGGRPATYGAQLRALQGTPQARADQLSVLVAVGVALVALTHLLAWVTGQAAGRRREVAGLRVSGTPPADIRAAYVAEAAVLGAIVVLAVGAVAAATTVALLRPVRLVGGWSEAPTLVPGVRPGVLALVLAGVLLVTVLACGVGFTRFGRPARPAALREDR